MQSNVLKSIMYEVEMKLLTNIRFFEKGSIIYVIAFPSSYFVETGFSRVSHVYIWKNALDSPLWKGGDLRLINVHRVELAERHQP